jgi:hypothetical protein
MALVSAALVGCGSQAHHAAPRPGPAVARVEALCSSVKSKLLAVYQTAIHQTAILDRPSLEITVKLESVARASAAVLAAISDEVASIQVAPHWRPNVQRAQHDLAYHHADLLKFEQEVRRKAPVRPFELGGWIHYFVERDLGCGTRKPAAENE